jgi:hypothetical protein
MAERTARLAFLSRPALPKSLVVLTLRVVVAFVSQALFLLWSVDRTHSKGTW